jgi:hypothetical protein
MIWRHSLLHGTSRRPLMGDQIRKSRITKAMEMFAIIVALLVISTFFRLFNRGQMLRIMETKDEADQAVLLEKNYVSEKEDALAPMLYDDDILQTIEITEVNRAHANVTKVLSLRTAAASAFFSRKESTSIEPKPETQLFKRPVSCIWSPNSNSTECLDLLSSLVCNSKRKKALGRRLLLLGDSTMSNHHLAKHVSSISNLTEAEERISSVCSNGYEYTCKPEIQGGAGTTSGLGSSFPKTMHGHDLTF